MSFRFSVIQLSLAALLLLLPSFGRAAMYERFPMNEHYRGENAAEGKWIDGRHFQVAYLLNEVERAKYRLTIKEDGRIYDADGNPFDTRDASSEETRGRAIFVMDEDGNFYASKVFGSGRFQHSSFLGGEPIAAGGAMIVIDGYLQLLSDHTGHYFKRHRSIMQNALTELRRQGVKRFRIEETDPHWDEPPMTGADF